MGALGSSHSGSISGGHHGRSRYFPLILLPLLSWGRGNPLLNQFTTIPLDLLTVYFGTADSPGGGSDPSLHPFITPLLTAISESEIQNYCSTVYNQIPAWKARANQLEASGRGSGGGGGGDNSSGSVGDNNSTVAEDNPAADWISLIDGPEQITSANWSSLDLECLQRLGYAPDRLPLGQIYGRIISLMGPRLILDIGQAIWGGKTIIEYQCDDNHNITITCNNVGHGTGAFAHATIGQYPEGRMKDYMVQEETERRNWRRQAQGAGGSSSEVVEPRQDWFFINYTQDFTAVCPSLLAQNYMNGPNTRLLKSGIFDNSWPARDVLDMGKWIGRDVDENLDIYLFKSRIADQNLKKLSGPVLWFNIKSADLVQNINIVRF